MLFPKETKENNSRYVEDTVDTVGEIGTNQTPDENIEDTKPLEINDSGREAVTALNEKCNAKYRALSSAKGKVREAQQAIRTHHSIHGDNNKEYVNLSNAVNEAVGDMRDFEMAHNVAKAEYENSKRRFGGKITF